jgi:cobalt-zinc-cadmium resistance protein CzcA
MLNAIISASLRHRLLVVLAFVALAVFGVQAVRTVPVDAFPDVTPNQVNPPASRPRTSSGC